MVFAPKNFVICTTMDGTTSNPPDNGALANDRLAFPDAKFSSDIPSAAGNMLAYINDGYKGLQIVGHGADGLIAVGGGQTPAPDQAIWMGTSDQWQQALTSLRGRVWALRLLGCHVGANSGGAALLYALATCLNCAVSAPTGLMITSSDGTVSYEAGTKWQNAGPGLRGEPPQLPAPIASPTPEDIDADVVNFGVKLLRNTGALDLDKNSIERIVVLEPQAVFDAEEIGLTTTKGSVVQKKLRAVLDRGRTLELLRNINFKQPVELGGALNALETASIQLETRDGQSYSFTIYNDQILQDKLNVTAYYRVSLKFRSTLFSLSTRLPVPEYPMSFIWAGPVRSKLRPTWKSESESMPFRLGNSHRERSILAKILLRTYRGNSVTSIMQSYVIEPKSFLSLADSRDTLPETEVSLEILSAAWS
jgi:hypothetical protein